MSKASPSRSWEWVNHARDNCRMAAGARHLLMVIATYADAAGHAHPSQRELADATGYDARHIRRLIDALETDGWLVTADGRGRGKRTDFTLVVEPVKADVDSRNSDDEKRTPEPGIEDAKADTQSHNCDEKSGHLEQQKRTSATTKADICTSAYKEVEPAIEPAIEPDGADAPASPAEPTAQTILAALIAAQPSDDKPTRQTIGRAAKELANLIAAKGAANVAEVFSPEHVAAGLEWGKFPFNSGLAGIWSAPDQAYHLLTKHAAKRREETQPCQTANAWADLPRPGQLSQPSSADKTTARP